MRGTLATIADARRRGADARSSSATSPALDLGWFEQRPLFGRRVVVTRAREQASELRARLEAARRRGDRAAGDRARAGRLRAPGPRALRVARVHVGERRRRVLRPRARARRPRRPRARRRCGSPRSVREPRARSRGAASAPISCPSASSPSRCSTRSRARRAGRAGAARPGRGRARRAARGSRRRGLRRRRARGVPHRRRPRPTRTTLARVRAGEVDAITFTSSSTVTNFCDAVGDAPRAAAARRLDRSGHVATRARRAGLRVDAEADPHTIDGLVDRAGARPANGSSARGRAGTDAE